MKRILLFVVTNLAILVVLSIVVSLLGLNRASTTGLLFIAAIFGMGGSFLSLAMSKWIAKRSTGAEVIDHPRDRTEAWLLQVVGHQAQAAGIGMPEVAIYPSPEINAFATGMSRDKALVAVSTGLLDLMDENEAEAVLGHEVSHVANGDMITLALVQGVLNTFVIFFARLAANLIGSFLSSSDEEEGESGLSWLGYMAVTIVLELILGVLASLVVMWFSRQREFRADIGGAKLAGRHKMIAALRRLQQQYEPSHLPEQMAAFGIASPGSGLAKLFMSHPPLSERIAALEAAR
ncbi:MAG: heat shock protein HtpX [Candidatus Entotheonella factor]|uniref:Protease HtpX homolog n=1 Tax=Entotheonella factor TaxID=1429438 RepID=W4LU07_ENTF1|nr:MAG: heat shock protein HtpX [Candidatus Entotheonella factor]